MYFYNIYKQTVKQNLIIPATSTIENSSSAFLSNCFLSVGVENSTGVQAQFAYLFFLTNKRPYMARKHPPKKQHRFAVKTQAAKIASFPSTNKFSYVMDRVYKQFMGKQLSPELPSVRIVDKFIKVIIWNAPLDKKTYGLQVNSSLFVEDVPLYVKFATKNFLWEENGFFVEFFKFLRTNSVAWLTLELDPYTYEDLILVVVEIHFYHKLFETN